MLTQQTGWWVKICITESRAFTSKRRYYLINNIFEPAKSSECSSIFIKLLVLSNANNEFTLLYGFCVPTKQPPYLWRFRDVKNCQRSIWSGVLSREEAMSFVHSLTTTSQINLGCKQLKSPVLLKRSVVLCNDGQNKTAGPVARFCRITEYWNIDKNRLLNEIEASIESDGKELYLQIQSLLKWACEECGIDFSQDPKRIGNFEFYDLRSSEDAFDIEIHKESGLKKTTILKRDSFPKDLIVNCIAEHRGRSILNQVKLFRRTDQQVDFYADEPMSRVLVQIWETESGSLVFSKDLPLLMSISCTVNIVSPTYQIRDPWSDKLFKSAANRSEIIKAQIESVSRYATTNTTAIKSSTHDAFDKAIEDSRTLFSGYQHNSVQGAFISNIQKEGEINSFLKIREYIDLSSVKKAVIVDPYFSVVSAQKLLARIPHTNIQLDIITSLTDTDPDTKKKTNILKHYREFLINNASILHNSLSIRNLTRGKTPVIHDRYLLRFFDDGRVDGFLLSNSFNSMGQFYPFVIAPMEQIVCYEVCDYINDLCDPIVQSKQPSKDRINIDLLCDFRSEDKPKTSNRSDCFPLDQWLPKWCLSGSFQSIPKVELESAVNDLWGHWEDEKKMTCKMLSHLASTGQPWSVKDLVSEIKRIDGADRKFVEEFAKIAKEKEQQQSHISRGIHSDEYNLSALLRGHAEPSRQGFSKLYYEAGHAFYSGDNWLRGGYELLLQIDSCVYVKLLDDINSPLMFDLLAKQMLLNSWDRVLFDAAINSKTIYVKLLCGEYMFHQLKECRLTDTQLEEAVANLSPEDRSLQLSYLLSQFAFHNRTSRSSKLLNSSMSVWMLKRLALDLSQCNEEKQSLALHWLHDCEVHSNCNLRMDLAAMVSDLCIKRRLYSEIVSAIEFNLIKVTYSRDITNLVDLYLEAMNALHGENIEEKLLGKIIDWRTLEMATEPVLNNYNYSKWKSADVRAKRQMHILRQYISRYPSSDNAKQWLEYWEPRMKAITQ